MAQTRMRFLKHSVSPQLACKIIEKLVHLEAMIRSLVKILKFHIDFVWGINSVISTGGVCSGMTYIKMLNIKFSTLQKINRKIKILIGKLSLHPDA